MRIEDYALYLCTDRILANGRDIESAVKLALDGGVTLVQIREKDASTREFLDVARRIQALTKERDVPLIINDRIDVALAIGADGVHLGQSDMPMKIARRILGNDIFIGISVSSVLEAIEAEREGADYLGVGAVFSTASKSDIGEAIGIECLKEICSAVKIPVVGIGGIGLKNASKVFEAGAAGISVISAILSQEDICASAKNLYDICFNCISKR